MRIETCQLYGQQVLAVGPGNASVSWSIQARTYRPWYIHALTIGGCMDEGTGFVMPVGYSISLEDFSTFSGGGNAPATAPPVEWPLDPQGGDSWQKNFLVQTVPPGNNRIILDRLINPGESTFTLTYLFDAVLANPGTFNYHLLIEFCPDESWRQP